MIKSFMDRRHESPDYEIVAWITGVRIADGKAHYNVEIEGAEDQEQAIAALERAIEVLRNTL